MQTKKSTETRSLNGSEAIERSGMQSHCQVQFHFNFRLGDDERACVQQPQILNFQLFSTRISSRFFLFYHFILFSNMKNDEQT